MEDMFNSGISGNKEPELTVSEISAYIKKCVETTFSFVRVRGEIFGAKRADSGHWYLSLKDENAVLSAVIWRGVASTMSVKPEDGLEVVATGKITTFAGKSSYQLVIEHLEPAGVGALLKLLEERKQAFAKEGLFDISHKKPIPFLPQTIGVVTSASGAVIRDIIHRVRDRFPSHILLIPAPVQGDGAAEKIAQAIKDFNRLDKISAYPKPDVLIVARGGGSLEDLWAFNEECVIRAVYESDIPVISAVGHETDTMLIDYVADKRAPTPTGAAEFAVPVRSDLLMRVNELEQRRKNGFLRFFAEKDNFLKALVRGIPDLSRILQEVTQKFDNQTERLHLAFRNYLKDKEHQVAICRLSPESIRNIIERNQERLHHLWAMLSSVSVGSVLSRGFAWVKDENGQTVYACNQAQKSREFLIRFADGEVHAANIGNKNIKKIKDNKNENAQISLFDL